MKVIKYWTVQLLQLSQPSGKLPGIINARNLVESLLFEGYSKDKPKINLGSGVNIELFTAPDSLETRTFRDHLVDSVRCIPVYEGDDETDGTQEEQTKPPSREAMIKYIKQAIGEGYHPEHETAVSDLSVLDWLTDGDLNREFGKCWQWYNLGGGIHETYAPKDEVKADSQAAKGRYNYDTFKAASKPLIQWLNENANPHASVIVDCASAVLFTGEIAVNTKEFLKD